jgi:hypothetical protein
MRLVVDTMEFGSKYLPQWNTISISGYHIREAGSTAVQELAFTLGDGLEYVRWGVERGMDVDEFAPRLSLFFNCHNDFFEEIAKFRAARRIWAREMKETFGAKNPRSWLCRFHTQTAGVSLTAQQPEINIVRVAIQALAAVIGGTQSLHTNSMDEALALPSEEAVTMAGPVFLETAPSHTKGGETSLLVSAEFLHAGENILIIDDFLATGQTLLALARMVTSAKATLVGVGTVVEKSFEGGRELLIKAGHRVPVEALVVIASMDDGQIILAQDPA